MPKIDTPWFLAPNRGLGARRGLSKRVDFLDPKSEQKKFRQGLALKQYHVAINTTGKEFVKSYKVDARPIYFFIQ